MTLHLPGTVVGGVWQGMQVRRTSELRGTSIRRVETLEDNERLHRLRP